MLQSLPIEPMFYAVAIPAVLLVGISKGGFGGAMAMIGTPLMALMITPVQAAAIMLPVLLMMDAIGLWTFRGTVSWKIVTHFIPGALLGIIAAWWTANSVSDDWTRLITGIIAIVFALNQILRDLNHKPPQTHNLAKAGFWGTIAGFTSFIAHAGGPPYQAYTLPLKLEKMVFAGTGIVVFAIINTAKVIPYFALGQFTAINLWTSISLFPIAIAGVLIGYWAVKRVSQALFYHITYLAMLMIGVKLILDGKAAIISIGL